MTLAISFTRTSVLSDHFVEDALKQMFDLAISVILDSYPLIDIRNVRRIHRVVEGGVFYDPAQLTGH